MSAEVRFTGTRTRTKDQQARRERLIDAAWTLAVEGGYPAVTMHDVADRAGGVARFVVAFALFVGGLVLMGSGMSGADGGVWLFVGGLAACTLAFALPMSGAAER